MKKRYNITLDASIFEEFKLYVDNVSGFFNSVMRRYVAYQKNQEKEKVDDHLKTIADVNLWED